VGAGEKPPPAAVQFAQALCVIAMVAGVSGVLVGIARTGHGPATDGRILVAVFATILCLGLRLRDALGRGLPLAWRVQVALSVLGLLYVPLGTALHALLLWQWFRPETKAWFGLK
jgi:hypothetical protein